PGAASSAAPASTGPSAGRTSAARSAPRWRSAASSSNGSNACATIARWSSRRPAAAASRNSSRYRSDWRATSTSHQRPDNLVQLVERHAAHVHLAVDEERWRGLDVQFVESAIAHPGDAVDHLLILQAGVEGRLRQAEIRKHRPQRADRLVDQPCLLALEQLVDGRGIFVLADAMRQRKGPGAERVPRKLAQDEADLAGPDVLLIEPGKHFAGEARAVRTGERGVLDHGDRRLRVAQHLLAQRARLHQVGG